MTTQPIDPRVGAGEAADEQLHTEPDTERSADEAEVELEAEEMIATELDQTLRRRSRGER
jgi:hypothetical protein